MVLRCFQRGKIVILSNCGESGRVIVPLCDLDNPPGLPSELRIASRPQKNPSPPQSIFSPHRLTALLLLLTCSFHLSRNGFTPRGSGVAIRWQVYCEAKSMR